MLSKLEMTKILGYLLADSGKEIRDEKVQVWFDQFGHLDPQIAWAAAKHLNVKGFKEWEPRTHEFRESVAFVQQKSSERISGDEAFHLALGAVRRYGSYQKEAALKSLPQSVAFALERFGYSELCLAEESKHGVHRAQFARIFDSAKDRKEFIQSVKPMITGDILKSIPAVQKLLSVKKEAA